MDITSDIRALLKSRHTLLWVVTPEELRVERTLITAASKVGYQASFWDCAFGLTDETGKVVTNIPDPKQVLDRISTYVEPTRMVYVLRDLHKWLADPFLLRQVRSLARNLQNLPASNSKTMIVLCPTSEVPLELQGCATVIEWPLPTRKEIGSVLENVLEAAGKIEITEDTREQAIDAAMGLTVEDALGCFSKTLVQTKTIDVELVAKEKKRVISASRVVTWVEPDPRGLDGVGGLELLKAWILERAIAFSPAAKEYGLPAPRGLLLLGVPGCGKSFIAKILGAVWKKPVLRLDMGALKSKFVGESEQNIRKALRTAEVVAPAILWVDEIEKALGGASGSVADGGVSADALGSLLSWMQDRTAPVFVIATANNVKALPSELLRKGRFDEMFFVDLPTLVERQSVLACALRKYGHDPEKFRVDQVAAMCSGFSGVEIDSLVPDAMFKAFADKARPITTKDLKDSVQFITPLSKSSAEKLDELRKWADGRCRPSSMKETFTPKTGVGRNLDLN